MLLKAKPTCVDLACYLSMSYQNFLTSSGTQTNIKIMLFEVEAFRQRATQLIFIQLCASFILAEDTFFTTGTK